jgi:hypothetical protein
MRLVLHRPADEFFAEEVWVPTQHVDGAVGPDGCWEQATDVQALWAYRKMMEEQCTRK